MKKDAEQSGKIDRLYALNAGLAIAPDRSVYTPGKWVGEQITLTCNAYLISRAGEWILWDTGIEESVEKESGGLVIAHNIRGIVTRSISNQLADIGITPEDVGTVILSHAHFDHVGNAELFQKALWYIQRREYSAMFGPDYEQHGYVATLYKCLRQARVELMDGDFDIFGDGSMKVISTPGHTPGHCSLLVRLTQTGPVLLSADVAHYRYNMEHHCVPSMNFSATDSKNSMGLIDAIIRDEGAQLWLNHDIVQQAIIPHAPAFFE